MHLVLSIFSYLSNVEKVEYPEQENLFFILCSMQEKLYSSSLTCIPQPQSQTVIGGKKNQALKK